MAVKRLKFGQSPLANGSSASQSASSQSTANNKTVKNGMKPPASLHTQVRTQAGELLHKKSLDSRRKKISFLQNIYDLVKFPWKFFTFTFLLSYVLLYRLVYKGVSIFPVRKSQKDTWRKKILIAHSAFANLIHRDGRSIHRLHLIDLSMRNMFSKRTRAIITMGGMAIGIAAIVFLVSIGYGVQEMVVRRVARLDELAQTDILPQAGSNQSLNDATIAQIKTVPGVKKVLPMISLVARVNFNNSVTDMAVYGVTSEYLTESAIKPSAGKIFESNDLSLLAPEIPKETATRSAFVLNDNLAPGSTVNFRFKPGTWYSLYRLPTLLEGSSGFSQAQGTEMVGRIVYGGVYVGADTIAAVTQVNGEPVALWVEAVLPVWQKQSCTGTAPDCIDGQYELSAGIAESAETVFLPLTSVEIVGRARTDTSSTIGLAGPEVYLGGEWTSLDELGVTQDVESAEIVSISSQAKNEAVVNRAMLQVLGLSEEEAVGKEFSSSFVGVGSLFDDPERKVQTAPELFKIIGVVTDDKTPYFYVPFADIRSIGVTHYSQAKVVVDAPNLLPEVRLQIESMGFSTSSVADTVKQIESLFGIIRIVLAVVGLVALSVASLGMFNTLTISLLERTREVGLMKAMGMRSQEVHELFLTESMVMGLIGGVAGVSTGYLAGKLLSLILSIISVSRGSEALDISFLPMGFVIFVLVLSLVVGVLTGIYPAKRATKISALNALRYE